MAQTKDVVVIGAGSAELTAGRFGARAGLATVVSDIEAPGGPILSTDHLSNYPGFPDDITGRKPAEQFNLQAKRCGCQVGSRAGSINLTTDRCAHHVSAPKDHFETKAVIAAIRITSLGNA